MSARTTPQVSTINPSIPKILRYLEWACLIMTILLLLFLILNKSLSNETKGSDYLISFCVLGVLAILSFFFPIRRPMWQRRVYVFAGISCVLVTIIFSDAGLGLFVFLYLAKSCFLLRRRDVIITVVLVGITWHVGFAWRLTNDLLTDLSKPIAEQQARFEKNLQTLQETPQVFIAQLIFTELVVYISLSVLITLLCLSLVAEYRSRQQAIALTQEVELLAADLERTRIARDIHDSLGHTLTSLDVQLELAQRLYERNSNQLQPALDTAKLLASQSLQEVRRAVTTMREETFDLNKALPQLLESFTSNPSITVKSKIDLPQLPLQTNHQLYCVVKEGLENIRKHSQAQVIHLKGYASADAVILELKDDGIGFDIAKPTQGFGLRGMQERVQLIGGSIQLDSTPGQGSCIQIRIPR
ncbi:MULTISPECIES: sensor histidine kinase [Moorena]|nr:MULTISPECIES: sensor histidine kinase [Moorena]NES85602.1 sensor histidine kinase [Moorena sp. SIO2B7]NEP31870.1 sensor histidine kinase [Moorena sp. SIO3B2]NEP67101.1 sensor histidine kinase [Moorena sp. SIO3A5]NER88802.1 sensor histidine kinase [Moorena sp. SIO3A2]OLT65507.1 two-component sensor histidine kinase [Moorena producens 3L]